MKLSNSINFLFIFFFILLGQGFNPNKIWSVDLNMDNMQSLGLRINLYSESIFCTMGMNYVGCAFFYGVENKYFEKLIIEANYRGPIAFEKAKETIVKLTIDLAEKFKNDDLVRKMFGDNFNANNLDYSINILNDKKKPWVCTNLTDWKNQLCRIQLKDKNFYYKAQNGDDMAEHHESLAEGLLSY